MSAFRYNTFGQNYILTINKMALIYHQHLKSLHTCGNSSDLSTMQKCRIIVHLFCFGAVFHLIYVFDFRERYMVDLTLLSNEREAYTCFRKDYSPGLPFPEESESENAIVKKSYSESEYFFL